MNLKTRSQYDENGRLPRSIEFKQGLAIIIPRLPHKIDWKDLRSLHIRLLCVTLLTSEYQCDFIFHYQFQLVLIFS